MKGNIPRRSPGRNPGSAGPFPPRPIRNSLGPYLERSGHRVLLAGDGVEALDLLGAYDVDIVVTDVLMPRMNEHELVRTAISLLKKGLFSAASAAQRVG